MVQDALANLDPTGVAKALQSVVRELKAAVEVADQNRKTAIKLFKQLGVNTNMVRGLLSLGLSALNPDLNRAIREILDQYVETLKEARDVVYKHLAAGR